MAETSLPDVVLLDTTNLCNARCPFCPLFTGPWQMDRELRPAGIMPQGLFEKITAELALWDRKPWLIISANAEILQDPLLSERLAALHRNGLSKSTQLLTNGQFLNQQATRDILDAGIGQIIIGFDGATREVYETHRVRCSYDRVLGNIRQFVEARRKHNHKTTIQLKFVRTRRNDHEVAAAHELFRGILDARLDYFHDCLAVDWSDGMGQTPNLYYLEQAQGERLASCHYFETGLQIQSDGKVGACCWDYNLAISGGGLGDVAASSVLEVWQGSRRAALRERLAQPDLTPEKCQKCIILHKSEPPADSLMKIPVGYLEDRGPTSFLYRLSARDVIN